MVGCSGDMMKSLTKVLDGVSERRESSWTTRGRGKGKGKGGASSSAPAAAEDSSTAPGRRGTRMRSPLLVASSSSSEEEKEDAVPEAHAFGE